MIWMKLNLKFFRFPLESSLIKMNHSSVTIKTKQIDEYLCKSSTIDPTISPSYSYLSWMYYWLIFWFDYPLIILFETTCLILSIYGTLKAKYNAYYNQEPDDDMLKTVCTIHFVVHFRLQITPRKIG